jgi:phosphate transport system substrate-binding protein
VKLNRFSIVAAALAAGSLALTACGGSSDTTSAGDGSSSASSASDSGKLSGTLNGAGSTAQQAAMQAWATAFQTANPDVTVNYDPVGSGGGREQFLAGGATLFAGSDAALTDEELAKAKTRCGGADALDLPVYVSPIAVAFNLKGVDSLQLSADNIAKLFSGTIKKWDDPAIAKENPGVKLPSTAVTPVHRSDDSGTTQNFTDYLSKAAPSSWTYPAAQTFPVKGGEAAEGTSGVVQAIKQGDGAVGYADESQVGDLGKVKVKVGDAYVEISAESAAKVAELSKPVPGRPSGDLAIDVARDTTEAGAYPIVLISYQIVCSKYDKASDAALVKAFETYVASDEGQQAAAKAAGSAPLASSLAQQVKSSIDLITGTG